MYKLVKPGWFGEVNGIKVARHPLPIQSGNFRLDDAGTFRAHHGIEIHRQQGDGNDITGTQIDRGYPICTWSIGNDGTVNQYCHCFLYAPWHGDSVSEYAFGIEHAGFTGRPFTPAQIKSSQALCAAIIEYTEDAKGENIPLLRVPRVSVQNFTTVRGFWDHNDVDDGPLNENGHTNHLEGITYEAYLDGIGSLLTHSARPAPQFRGMLLLPGVDAPDAIIWKRRMGAKGLFVRSGANDGPHYGNVIERATRVFQQHRGLTVDGIVGPITWREAWNH